MEQKAITKANKILHDLNFDKYRSTTQIVAEGLQEYAKEQCNIPIVSKSLRDKEQFIELAKMIEIHIKKSVDYKASIGTGYFTERFNEVYKKYLESNVC